MPEKDIEMIMGILEKIQKDINDIKLRHARDERKRLECQDVFDERYVTKHDFRAYFQHEWRKLCSGGWKIWGLAKDIVWVINIGILLGIAIYTLL